MGLTGLCFFLSGCEDYLAEKPSSSLAIPSSVRDFQALIDYQARMNEYYPESGDIAADYYYLTETDWGARSDHARDTYVWKADVDSEQDWAVCYEKIFYANVVLEGIDDALLDGLGEPDRQQAKGAALFIRGWTYYHLSQLFVPQYRRDEESSGYGLPLRFTPDINAPTERSTVGDTYRQIEADLKQAAQLLPERAALATRPSKAAAYAALARLYLTMGRYDDALEASDSCLAIQSELMDYNTLDANQANSFAELNPEVIFNAMLSGLSGVHAAARARVDTVLYSSYDEDDLRRYLFFDTRADGSLQFKGSYYGNIHSVFAGLAVDEVYLIKAESLIRTRRREDGVRILDELLARRWQTGTYVARQVATDEQALRMVLEEREKELVFRGGIRWSDLRRLNAAGFLVTTLKRTLGGVDYLLEANDPRYTFLIPSSVIGQNNIVQNLR